MDNLKNKLSIKLFSVITKERVNKRGREREVQKDRESLNERQRERS